MNRAENRSGRIYGVYLPGEWFGHQLSEDLHAQKHQGGSLLTRRKERACTNGEHSGDLAAEKNVKPQCFPEGSLLSVQFHGIHVANLVDLDSARSEARLRRSLIRPITG